MTLNLPLLYWFWFVEYCQTSPIKNKSPNLWHIISIFTDRKNVTNFLYLVLHLACKVTSYFNLFNSILVSVLRTSINVLSKSKSRNYVTWIPNLTKLFLSVKMQTNSMVIPCLPTALQSTLSLCFSLHSDIMHPFMIWNVLSFQHFDRNQNKFGVHIRMSTMKPM